MRITADTNLLLRVLMLDDSRQAQVAKRTLELAEVVAFSTAVLCEVVWVLKRGRGWDRQEIAKMLRALLNDPRAVAEWEVVESGLTVLEQGGDFADGIVASDGARLGGEVFATFDTDAAKRLSRLGRPVKLLS